MQKKDFLNSCDNNTYKIKQQLDSVRDFVLDDAEFRKLLDINEWDKTIDLEKLEIYHYLAMSCLYKYTKPRSYSKHSKLREKIERILHI